MTFNPEITRPRPSDTTLVLADFADGSLEATWFARQFIRFETLRFLQCCQKPDYGRFMMHDLLPVLKRNAKQELRELKYQAVHNLSIGAGKIRTKVFGGSLVWYLQNRLNDEYNPIAVVSLNKAFRNASHGLTAQAVKLIKTTTLPLVILPEKYQHRELRKILWLSGTDRLQVRDTNADFALATEILKTTKNSTTEFINASKNFHFADEKDSSFKNVTRLLTQWFPICPFPARPEKIWKNHPADLVVIERKTFVIHSITRTLKLTAWLRNSMGIPLLFI